MESTDLFLRFGVALAIGFLIGLQREYAHGGPAREIIAGERTFALFGLADVDAITLSIAELSKTGVIEMPKAALAIVLATMSNTTVKGGIALAMARGSS